MKFYHNNRKRLKWLGLSLTLLFIAMWLASGICYCGYAGRTARIEIVDGRIQFWQGIPDLTSPHGYAGTNPRYRLMNDILFQGRLLSPWNANAILIPLWYFAVFAAIPTAAVWIQDAAAQRRLQLGKCRHCRFDLTGLPHGAVCPECGKATGQKEAV